MVSRLPTQQFVDTELPKLPEGERPLECTQRAGDLMFVPRAWGHGILNLEHSVGFAIELQMPLHAFQQTMLGSNPEDYSF